MDQKFPTVSGKSIAKPESAALHLKQVADRFPLSWSHYVRLLALPREEARHFYETEALRCGWSVRQLDRVQQGFESTLDLPANRARSLEELNAKLAHWIQTVYHLRAHGSTGVSPQQRFAQAAGTLRHIDAGGSQTVGQ